MKPAMIELGLAMVSFFRWVLVGSLVFAAVALVAFGRWCWGQVQRWPR